MDLFPDEEKHLEAVMELLEKACRESDESVRKSEHAYKDTKRYMAEYRHEIDPNEIFQTELILNDIGHSGMIAVRMRDRLRKLLESPYFARIDFRQNGETEPSAYYIGRFTFANGHEILIFDWRSPIAGMFYEYELGAAGYNAPAGRIEGELLRKRQFKISSGKMEYAIETSLTIQDDVLRQELSSNSDEKMKTIIATLQRQQNEIVRNEKEETLIIQGTAGSGKTSIALHRIAYLLYRSKDTLSAKNIVILSPNRVFGDYISEVLPELGEEPIYEMSFADIAAIQLEGIIGFESDRDPLEYEDREWSERVRFKSSLEFIMQLDNYLDEVSEAVFCPEDYVYEDFRAEREWIRNRYHVYHNYPVKKRLKETADDIYEKLYSDNIRGEELPGRRTILKSLNKMTKLKSTLALYKEFYRKIKQDQMFVMPSKKTLEWTDVYPFLYMHAHFGGLKENQLIKHIVIDEMQDYTPIQYKVINLLFRCKKTILGDFGQSIHLHNQNSLDCMAQIYPDGEIIRLNKSYRSSYEIITFAGKIYTQAEAEPVERHGDTPEITRCTNKEEQILKITALAEAFKNSGYATMGIITKTKNEAETIYEALAEMDEVHLITPQSDRFSKGITITPVQMAKGLEFDEVILPSVDLQNYKSESDRKLLYIACTRAMHKLVLLYCGERSKLIQ